MRRLLNSMLGLADKLTSLGVVVGALPQVQPPVLTAGGDAQGGSTDQLGTAV